ncbi:hypothetical protein NLI96_g9464 [Meripilus lineatus]|uniref:BIR-domain-containing protein n=1 Tax=Meripilus lineatus TaxID=2056292 RepID=A0AAD5UVN1_9APHY|nr:hypothetical protein NLI96_g9464 [Physisporinus lineatus]
METLQARLDSFTKGSKRAKGSLAKSTSTTWKWPHPPTFKATPNTLAEAGFWFNPGRHARDNVRCFICGKELAEWEPDDDPFEIHWEKCGRSCAWAIVRCGLKEDVDEGGSYVFPNSSRSPTCRAMDKARLETFTNNDWSWPHDDVRGHGASSKKMAKAGFVYTPQEPGDDTASCFYCGLSLSGWVESDDPSYGYHFLNTLSTPDFPPSEEHLKREEKRGEQCPFFGVSKASATSLGRSTSKPPPRAASKPPTKSTSRSARPQSVVEEEEEEAFQYSSESDLTSLAPSTVKSKARSSTRSKPSASKVVATPASNGTAASRKSTRGGASGSRKASASREGTGSEMGEQMDVSGSETGKRVHKSKKGSRGKNHIGVIEEEEEEEGIEGAPVVEEEPKPVAKPKRGRPPGSKKTPAASTGKGKKTQVEKVLSEDDSEVPPEPVKVAPTQTRSKITRNADSDSSKVSSKPSGSRTKSSASSAKSKIREVVESEDELILAEPAPPSNRGQEKKALGRTNGVPSTFKIGPPSKGRSVSRSKSKAKGANSDSDAEIKRHLPQPKVIPASVESDNDESPPPSRPMSKVKAPKPVPGLTVPEGSRVKGRKSSNTSDDAGYATAELAMDIDEDRPAAVSKTSPVVGVITSATHADRDSGLAESLGESLPAPTSKPKPSGVHVPLSRQAPTSSRISSANRLGSQPSRRETASTAVVDISSDDDDDDVDLLKPPSILSKATSSPPQTDAPFPPSSSTSRSSPRFVQPQQPAGSIEVPFSGSVPDSGQSVPKRRSTKETLVAEVVIPVSDGKRTSKSKRSLDIEMVDATNEEQVDLPRIQVPIDVDADDDMDTGLSPPRTPTLSPIEGTATSTPPLRKATTPLPELRVEDETRSFESFTPYLSLIPMAKITNMTEEEADMTIEQYIRRELERQYQQLKQDGQKRIEEFKQKAAETRALLVDSFSQ